MPTSEFSTSKTVFILAVIAGCFAILWPKVFYPMMQAAFTITKPRSLSGVGVGGNDQVCCDVISEDQVEVHLFAAVCQSVIARELATEGGLRKYRHQRYPPPGMLERCRKRIAHLCDGLDVSEALLRTAQAGVLARTTAPDGAGATAGTTGGGGGAGQPEAPASLEDRELLANLSGCLKRLESERLVGEARVRRSRRPAQSAHLPSHVRQERPPHMGAPATHPALKERGNPFPAHLPPAQMAAQQASKQHLGPSSGLRPPGGMVGPGKSAKGSGAMGLLMPIYTVGIVVFFAYTISKVWFRKPEDRTPKILDFHMDPEYRKYVLSEEYGGRGTPLTYEEFVRQREAEERKRAAAKLLTDAGSRKQVFTAIEGIIAEMDVFRDKLMADQKSIDLEEDPLSEEESMCVTQSELDSESVWNQRGQRQQQQQQQQHQAQQDGVEMDEGGAPEEEGFECETPEPSELQEEEADLVLDAELAQLPLDDEEDEQEAAAGDEGWTGRPEVEPLSNGVREEEVAAATLPMDLASQLARLAVMGIDTQADFHERVLAPEDDPDDPEVAMEIANILLQTSVPEDAQLLVSASQCLTHTPTEPLEGWWTTTDGLGEDDEQQQPVVVTGKMTISLLARGESPSGLPGFHHHPPPPLQRPGSTGARTATPEVTAATAERAVMRQTPVPPPDDERTAERRKAAAQRQREQIEELANNLVQDILHNQVPRVLERQSSGNASNTAETPAAPPPPPPSSGTTNGHLAATRPAASGPPSRRRRPSRESLSQGSSFEYLSACGPPTTSDAAPVANGHHQSPPAPDQIQLPDSSPAVESDSVVASSVEAGDHH